MEIESLSDESYVRSFKRVSMLNVKLEFIVGRGESRATFPDHLKGYIQTGWYRKIEIPKGQRPNHESSSETEFIGEYSPPLPIEDSQDTTSEFQSTVFCFPNQRSEKPFGLLQIRRTSRQWMRKPGKEQLDLWKRKQKRPKSEGKEESISSIPSSLCKRKLLPPILIKLPTKHVSSFFGQATQWNRQIVELYNRIDLPLHLRLRRC